MGDAAPAPDACYNCAAPLAGAYCAVCGQKALPLNPRLHDFLHDFTHEMLHVNGKMFLLVPLFAWLVHRGYRRTGRNYPQHLYFALHVRAAWFAAGTIAAAAALVSWPFFPQAVAALALAYAGIYVVLSFRAAYGGTKGRRSRVRSLWSDCIGLP